MQPARPQGPVVVQAAAKPEALRTPEVPNIPETYKSTWPTLALIVGGVILGIIIIVGVIMLLRRRR